MDFWHLVLEKVSHFYVLCVKRVIKRKHNPDMVIRAMLPERSPCLVSGPTHSAALQSRSHLQQCHLRSPCKDSSPFSRICFYTGFSHLFSARATLHPCPHLARNPADLNPDSDHMDLASWLGLGFTSSACTHLLTSTFGWRLSTDLSWLPSSGTADLALFGVTLLCLSLLNDKDTSATMLEGK